LRPLAWLLSVFLAAAGGKAAAPTFCAEWIRQSAEGYERFTLFSDRTLVWKESRGGAQQVRRKRLAPDESEFYCSYFARPEFWELPSDLRTGPTGDLVAQSSVTLTRPDGSRKQILFHDMSALPADAASLRSSLEGLRAIFVNPIAPASRFTPQTLSPGTIVKRFDGAVFRVRRVEVEKGLVELEGVRDPYSLYKRIEELRFQFFPPE